MQDGYQRKMKRMKELCEERNSLYEKQNELKGQRGKLERSFVRKKRGGGGLEQPDKEVLM